MGPLDDARKKSISALRGSMREAPLTRIGLSRANEAFLRLNPPATAPA
jgi:hypothetical protein